MTSRARAGIAAAIGIGGVGCLVTAPTVRAESVTYTLDNVVLDDNNAVLTGTFVWTYTVGDFQNGSGQFSALTVPFTVHDETDLDAVFDVGGSIEITLPGSVHDDGVDITLFLAQALTPTSGSPLDLATSKYEIGGNGFHTGVFLGGAVVPSGVTGAPEALPASGTILSLAAYPNPFRRATTVSYSVGRAGPVRIAVHDVRGRLVATVVDRWHAPGEYRAAWDGGGLGTGVYFVRCLAGNTSTSSRIVRLP